MVNYNVNKIAAVTFAAALMVLPIKKFINYEGAISEATTTTHYCRETTTWGHRSSYT